MVVKVTATRTKTRNTVEPSSIPNFDFDVNTTGWVPDSNTTLSWQSTPSEGAVPGAARLVSTVAGTISISYPGRPVVAGTNYEFDMFAATSGTARNTWVSLEWYSGANSTGTLLSTSSGPQSLTSTTFGVRKVNAQAPTGAVSATLRISITGVGAGAIHYVDTASFTVAVVAPPTPTTYILLDQDAETATVANPISNADMWAFVGDNTGSGFSQTSVVNMGGTRGKVIELHYPTNDVGGSAGISMFPQLSRKVDEAMIEYDVYFVGANFDFGWGGKLPGLGGIATSAVAAFNAVRPSGDPAWGTSPPTGGNPSPFGFTARFMWRPDAHEGTPTTPGACELTSYIYLPSQAGGTYGADRHTRADLVGNRVYRIGQYHKMNTVLSDPTVVNSDGTTSGGSLVADGVHEIYVDGVLKYSNTTTIYRKFAETQIGNLCWSTFYGGATVDWAPAVSTSIQFDNILITTPQAA